MQVKKKDSFLSSRLGEIWKISSRDIFSILIYKADRTLFCVDGDVVCQQELSKEVQFYSFFQCAFFPLHSHVGDVIWFLSHLSGFQIFWLRKRASINPRNLSRPLHAHNCHKNIFFLHLSLYLIILTIKDQCTFKERLLETIIFVLFSLAPVCLCLAVCPLARSGTFGVITLTSQETEQNVLVRIIIQQFCI